MKKNSNFLTFSPNIYFELKYLENRLANYSDHLHHSLAFLKLFHMGTICISFVVALLRRLKSEKIQNLEAKKISSFVIKSHNFSEIYLISTK